MIPVYRDQLFLTLDNVFDVQGLLELEDEFYQFFAKNYSKSSSVWAAGSIDLDTVHPYIKENPYLYHVYHKEQFDFSTDTRENCGQGLNNSEWTEELSIYLQLKFGAINPYRFLHLIDHQKSKEEKTTCLNSWVLESKKILSWIENLPFTNIQNISLIFTPKFIPQGYHRDFNLYPIERPETVCKDSPSNLDVDIIWCRFNLDRPFYLYDIDDRGNIVKEFPVSGYTGMFNHYNWHGNINPASSSSLTIKIEGKFKPEFKQKIQDSHV
jgi:hypothetical protein